MFNFQRFSLLITFSSKVAFIVDKGLLFAVYYIRNNKSGSNTARLLHKERYMNVATVKTGRRGRPRHRVLDGILFFAYDGLVFKPSDRDFFDDSVRVSLSDVESDFVRRNIFANSDYEIPVSLRFSGSSSGCVYGASLVKPRVSSRYRRCYSVLYPTR